jgi:hypothetical protein
MNEETIGVQKCKQCGVEKPLSVEYFWKKTTNRTKFDYVCKACRSIQDKQYKEDNKLRIAEYSKQYQKLNKDKLNNYQNEYRIKNKESILIREVEYYLNNSEVLLLNASRSRLKNRETINERQRLVYNEKILANANQILTKYFNETTFNTLESLQASNISPTLVYVNQHFNENTGESFVKIGLTKHTVLQRYSYKEYKKYPYVVLKIFPFKDLEDAKQLERILLNATKQFQYVFTQADTFNGYTECRHIDCLAILPLFD